jgi:hypothetical protein
MAPYEIGKPFPHEQFLNIGEATVALPVGQFFDVLCCKSRLTDNETTAFKQGRLKVSLFERYHIPFIIFDLGSGFIFKVALDAKEAMKEEPDWMTEQANEVNMFLVDATTGILKATRIINLPEILCEKVREIIAKQLSRKSESSVENDVKALCRMLSINDMIDKAIDRCIFKQS